MFFLIRKFKDIRLNRHVFSLEDAYQLCADNGVEIVEADIDQKGFYMKICGVAKIYVNPNVRGLERLYVILHELAHHLLHASNYQNAAFFFLSGQDSKQHHEAEAFALLAMLPERYLRRLLSSDLLGEIEGYPKEVLVKRLELLRVYGV